MDLDIYQQNVIVGEKIYVCRIAENKTRCSPFCNVPGAERLKHLLGILFLSGAKVDLHKNHENKPLASKLAEISVFRGGIEQNIDLIRSILPADFMLFFSLEGQGTISRGSKVTLESRYNPGSVVELSALLIQFLINQLVLLNWYLSFTRKSATVLIFADFCTVKSAEPGSILSNRLAKAGTHGATKNGHYRCMVGGVCTMAPSFLLLGLRQCWNYNCCWNYGFPWNTCCIPVLVWDSAEHVALLLNPKNYVLEHQKTEIGGVTGRDRATARDTGSPVVAI
ncbi:hypothetical protein llap_3567 [Limosa lapponica baueri]|uniref:Uncharacterized protein n=1 Tax=Limosa lapponica baueri TaxID=1758121 RepID=A0A2I0UJA4_LIMLA|nr:hypothetical protein llap_3567 [Limosa lapponica baueri]